MSEAYRVCREADDCAELTERVVDRDVKCMIDIDGGGWNVILGIETIFWMGTLFIGARSKNIRTGHWCIKSRGKSGQSRCLPTHFPE